MNCFTQRKLFTLCVPRAAVRYFEQKEREREGLANNATTVRTGRKRQPDNNDSRARGGVQRRGVDVKDG